MLLNMNCKINRKAFTLIEILVTLSIIVVMVVVAVPSFEKYGKKTQFKQKMNELNSVINSTYLNAKNPSPANSKYVLDAGVANGTSLYAYGDKDTNKQEINIKANGVIDSLTTRYLICYNKEGFCQLDGSENPSAVSKLTDQEWLKIESKDYSDLRAVFTLKSDPFSSSVKYQNFNGTIWIDE